MATPATLIPGNGNCLHNLPVNYSIYYINHSKVVYITPHTTLDLGHRKFSVRYTPRAKGKGRIYCKLPQTSVSDSIFAITYIAFLPGKGPGIHSLCMCLTSA